MAETIERLAVLIEANTKSYERAMRRLETKTNNSIRGSQKSFKRLNRSMKATGNTAANLSRRFLSLFGTALAVRSVVNYADAWTRVGRSIKSTESIFGVRLRSTEALSKLAIETRSDLESLSVLYTRTAAATRDLGTSEADVATITTTLAKALKLGSASASEADSVLRQFSQALQKGKLDGDEFRSVMENAGIVSKALSEELNVTKGELLELAADGKIRIETLIKAMKRIAPEVSQAFEVSNSTVAESFNNLSTRLAVFVGKLDDATDASKRLSRAIDLLSKFVENVTPTSEFEKLTAQLAAAEEGVNSFREDFERIKSDKFQPTIVINQFRGTLDGAIAEVNRLKRAIAGLSSDNEALLPDLPPLKSSVISGKLPGALPKTRPKNLNELAFKPARSSGKSDARSVIDSLIFESEQLRRTSEQQAIYNALKDAGVAAASKQGQIIRNLVTEIEAETRSQDALNSILEQTNQLGRDVFGRIIQGIREGAKASDILANSLSRVGDKLANLALDSIFGGGGGGLFASLFGGSNFAGAFAGGGNIPSGQFGLVGERGPEFISGPATITPIQSGRGAGRNNVHVTVGVSESNGNLRPFVESIARSESAIAARKVAASVPSIVDARSQEREVRRIRPGS